MNFETCEYFPVRGEISAGLLVLLSNGIDYIFPINLFFRGDFLARYDKTEHLYTLIHKINRKLRNPKFDSTDHKESPPVTKVQWWILKTLWERNQCTAGYLAKTIGVRPSTMSQMLDRLEKAGFLTRFADIADARVRIIRLTDKGQSMFHESETKFVQKLAGPLEFLTPQEQQTLIRLMEKLIENFPRPNRE